MGDGPKAPSSLFSDLAGPAVVSHRGREWEAPKMPQKVISQNNSKITVLLLDKIIRSLYHIIK